LKDVAEGEVMKNTYVLNTSCSCYVHC